MKKLCFLIGLLLMLSTTVAFASSFEMKATQSGDTLELSVCVSEKTKLSAINLDLNYDTEALMPTKVTYSEQMTGGMRATNVGAEGVTDLSVVTVLWVDIKNHELEDEIYTVTFDVTDDKKESFSFSLSYLPDNVIFIEDDGATMTNVPMALKEYTYKIKKNTNTDSGKEKPDTPTTEKPEKPSQPVEPKPEEEEKKPEFSFTDLEGYDWAKDAIYDLYNKGIVKGTSATEYSPQNPIRRCDFLLLYMRMTGEIEKISENFDDCAKDAYYYDAIGTAKKKGYTDGAGNNLFLPDNNITRQDMCVMTYRILLAAGKIEEPKDFSSLDAFQDKDQISDYALPAMAALVEGGYIRGSGENVNPKANTTRAETAVFLSRLQ